MSGAVPLGELYRRQGAEQAFGPPPKKMAVFTLAERGGAARSKHVADVTSKTLREAIVTRASRKSYLMTDEALQRRVG